jgi:hypothetical protein
MMPTWSMMNRVSGWRSIRAVPASILPQHRILTGRSQRTAARTKERRKLGPRRVATRSYFGTR